MCITMSWYTGKENDAQTPCHGDLNTHKSAKRYSVKSLTSALGLSLLFPPLFLHLRPYTTLHTLLLFQTLQRH